MNEKLVRHVARYAWFYAIAVCGALWVVFISLLIEVAK
jgi:hypothetical protein